MALRRAPKPVVAAPYNLTLGGGAEVAMAADRMVAHAELYMGLPELGVGLIPGWGGCKELVRRNVSPHIVGTNVNPTPYLRQIFEVVGFAEEEGQRYKAVFLGSGALTGHFDPAWFDQKDADGITMRAAMLHAGLCPDDIPKLKRDASRYLGKGVLEGEKRSGVVLAAAVCAARTCSRRVRRAAKASSASGLRSARLSQGIRRRT